MMLPLMPVTSALMQAVQLMPGIDGCAGEMRKLRGLADARNNPFGSASTSARTSGASACGCGGSGARNACGTNVL
jgi:hypothetical protein